jgi:hypothetical protein
MRISGIRPLIAASMIVISGLAMAGCGGGGILGSIGPGGNTTTMVKSLNALQGCPNNIDVEQVGVQPIVFTNLAYGVIPAGYTSIRAGTGLHYAVFNTGQTINPLATADVDLLPHDPSGNPNTGTYTLVATGICGLGAGATSPQLVRLIDAFPSNFTGTGSGTVGLRLINLVPDLTAGITLVSNGAALHGTDDPGTNDVPYAATSGFNSSHYNSGINLTGSPTLTVRTNTIANTILGTVQNFTFAPNHAYTIFVIGEMTPAAGAHVIQIVPVQDF